MAAKILIKNEKSKKMSESSKLVVSFQQMQLMSKNEKFNKHSTINGADLYIVAGKFGQLLVSRFRGEGFTIWFNNYNILQPIQFNYSNDYSYFLHTAWAKPSVIIADKNTILFDEQQFDMFYVHDNVAVSVTSPGNYQTFTVDFSQSFLQPYTHHCRQLSDLVTLQDTMPSGRMLDRKHFLSFDCISAIRKIISYEQHPGLTRSFFTTLIHELITFVVIQVELLKNDINIRSCDLESAKAAKNIIIKDFQRFHSVEDLAKQTGTTEIRLQSAFRHFIWGNSG